MHLKINNQPQNSIVIKDFDFSFFPIIIFNIRIFPEKLKGRI